MAIQILETFFEQFFCIFLPPLLIIFCFCYILMIFCYLSCPSLHKMLPYYFQFYWSDLWSYLFYCFPLFLCIIYLFKKAFLSLLCKLWKASIGYIFPFLLCLLLLFLPQLFVKPPQTTTLPSFISFYLGWFSSLPPVQCYELPSIVLQTLCLPDLIPWIYFSLPLYSYRDLI